MPLARHGRQRRPASDPGPARRPRVTPRRPGEGRAWAWAGRRTGCWAVAGAASKLRPAVAAHPSAAAAAGASLPSQAVGVGVGVGVGRLPPAAAAAQQQSPGKGIEAKRDGAAKAGGPWGGGGV